MTTTVKPAQIKGQRQVSLSAKKPVVSEERAPTMYGGIVMS